MSFLPPFLYMTDIIPTLAVTPIVPSFPEELKTSKRTGASSVEECI